MTQEKATAEFASWRRSKIFRSPEGREWIEIENDDRMICEISNQYLALVHLEKEDEDIADLMVTAVNERDALLSEVAQLKILYDRIFRIRATGDRGKPVQGVIDYEAKTAFEIALESLGKER